MAERAPWDWKVPVSIPTWIQWGVLLNMTHIDISKVIISPKSEPTLKQISGLHHQVWRQIKYMVLTQEEIPEEGR